MDSSSSSNQQHSTEHSGSANEEDGCYTIIGLVSLITGIISPTIITRHRKGRDLAAMPHAALQFHWVSLERVVRIEGRVELASADESDACYKTRPLAHRIGAWASEQSEVIPNRGVLVTKAAEYGLKFGVRPPRPPHWGGYRLQPDYWEFWQGRKSRLHDRIAYRLEGDSSWTKERLSP